MFNRLLNRKIITRKSFILISIASISFILDHITKQLVINLIEYHDEIHIIKNFLTITHVHNRGAAFSLFSELGFYFFLIVSLVAIGFIFYFFIKTEEREISLSVAFSMILGGALGNLFDRIRFGYVIDFIDVHWYSLHWPAFNVADITITIGIAILIKDSIIKSSQKESSLSNKKRI